MQQNDFPEDNFDAENCEPVEYECRYCHETFRVVLEWAEHEQTCLYADEVLSEDDDDMPNFDDLPGTGYGDRLEYGFRMLNWGEEDR